MPKNKIKSLLQNEENYVIIITPNQLNNIIRTVFCFLAKMYTRILYCANCLVFNWFGD